VAASSDVGTRFFASGTKALAILPEALSLKLEIKVDRPNLYEGGLGVVTIAGPTTHHDSGELDSFDCIVERFEEAFAHEDVKVVVANFDSPGGEADGMMQAHARIRRLRKKYGKPLYAYANETMASAAYGLGSACDEIWLPRTGKVGSIGVIAILEDHSKANERAGVRVTYLTTGECKADGRPDQPLTPAIEARLQAQIDLLGREFWSMVAKARGMSIADVAALQAGVKFGKRAVKAGIADGVADWDPFIAIVRKAHGLESSVTTNPVSQSHGGRDSPIEETRRMSVKATLLKLTEAKTSALASLSAAKTDQEKSLAAAALVLADAEITKFNAARMRHVEKTVTHEEEDGGDEEEDDEGGDTEASDDEDDDEEHDRDDDDEDDDDEEECDRESSSKALLAHNGRRAKKLFAAVKSLTGVKTFGEALGALEGLSASRTQASSNDGRLAKLERENRRNRVNALLQKAKADGKVTPGQMAALLEKGSQSAKDYQWLKGYVATLPKVMRSRGESIDPGTIEATTIPTVGSQLDAILNGGAAKTDAEKIIAAMSVGLKPAEREAFKQGLKNAQDNPSIAALTGGANKGTRF
jgi:ClpP class serine protease